MSKVSAKASILPDFDLGQIEHIVDEREQVGAGLVDLFQIRDEVVLSRSSASSMSISL